MDRLSGMDIETKQRPDGPTDRPAEGPIRGEIRLKGWRRVSHGLFVLEEEGLGPDEEFRRDLQAWLLVLPAGAVFTHLTAAVLLGWRQPKLPEQLPVFAAVRGDVSRPRRPGLICSRLTSAATPGTCWGLPVDRPEEILLRCARDLGLLDLTVLVESALALGHLDADRMAAILDSRRPGVVRLREAWRRACPKSESAGESLLHLFHDVIGVKVEAQVELFDDEGTFLGRGDLGVVGTRFVHEYDGAVHRDAAQHRADLRRERGWDGNGYVRKGFTLDDLLNHAAVTMHEVDRALGRPHDPRRLETWRALVAESLYSEIGRQRIMNRWHRSMGARTWVAAA